MSHKLQHIWSVLCSSSVTDSETNMMSLHNIVEQLNIENPPQVVNPNGSSELNVTNLSLELVNFFERDEKSMNKEETVDLTLDFIDPHGKAVNTGKYPVPFKKGFKRMRYLIKIPGLKINGAGEYHFKLQANGKEVASIPLDVKFQVKL